MKFLLVAAVTTLVVCESQVNGLRSLRGAEIALGEPVAALTASDELFEPRRLGYGCPPWFARCRGRGKPRPPPTDPPTDIPTEQPPTDVPPTEAPPTQDPPTEAPPTQAPPTPRPTKPTPPTDEPTVPPTNEPTNPPTNSPTNNPPTNPPTQGPPTNPPTNPPGPNPPVDGWVIEMLKMINKVRTDAGLNPVCLNAKLNYVAEAHSVDMATKNYFGHNSLDGTDPLTRARNAGYEGGDMENIAAGYATPEEVMDGLMGSPLHKANILGDHTQVGLGRGYNQDSKYKTYWSQDFGKSTYEPCLSV